MGNTFLTVIGTGIYTDCTYSMDGMNFHSRYIQEAILRILKEKDIKIDKIVCLATREAKDANWYAFSRRKLGMKNRELRNVEVPDTVQKFLKEQGLWEDTEICDTGLKDLFADIYPAAQVECVEIPLGSNEEELLQIFQTMYDAMAHKDNLYIDVTHGFRSMPMLYIPVIQYAEAVKHINVEAVYYGAFEVRGEVKPVFNLEVYKEILDWAFASQNFIQYGISTDLARVAGRRNKILNMNKDGSFNAANRFVQALNHFTDCIQTGRGNEFAVKFVNGNKQISAKKDCIRSEYQKLEDFDYAQIDFPVLIPLLQEIQESISEFAQKGNTAIGLATIHWCAKKGMIQQGYTALEETIKSFVCDLYGYENESDRKVRDEAIGTALTCCSQLVKESGLHDDEKMAYFKDNQSHFFEMAVEKGWRIPQGDGESLFKKVLQNIPLELANFAEDVKDKRNDINHFGMRSNSSSPKKLVDIFNKHVEQFDELYKRYEYLTPSDTPKV